MTTYALCCAGKSMPGRLVPEDATIVAISTAIRCIHAPAIWITVDFIPDNEAFRPVGDAAFANPKIQKITTGTRIGEYKPHEKRAFNLTFMYVEPRPPWRIRGSLTFAMSCLEQMGATRMILYGVDCNGEYVFDHESDGMKETRRADNAGRNLEALWDWCRNTAHVTVLSGTPNSPINEFCKPC